MKATLEFNLPDEELEYNFANSGQKYYCALWEMDQWLRSKIKYDESLTDEQQTVFELCREELRMSMSNNRVSFTD